MSSAVVSDTGVAPSVCSAASRTSVADALVCAAGVAIPAETRTCGCADTGLAIRACPPAST